ncbi:MAG: ribosome rescue protein RqcH [Candidatus Bathyarchaeota archaeon]|nr:ribosome rescue protein RqcH [Candidatus Bathyarchaeota archaeon]
MVKKELTSFDVAAVVRELKEAIQNSHVSNIYQTDYKTLVFKLHRANEPPILLIVEAGRRLHLTSYNKEKPSTPPLFCMALRKYLRNGWLMSVEQHEFERIVRLTFKTREGSYQLIMELFGDGNLILINEKNTILQALSYKRMRDRNILRGETFIFPPPSGKNPFKTSKQELAEGLKASGDVETVRALARLIGVGGIYAEELLLRAGIDKTKPCSSLSNKAIEAIFGNLQKLLSQVVTSKLEPCVILDDQEGFVDATPFRLECYKAFRLQPFASFNEALDEFYIRTKTAEKASAAPELERLKREAERLKRTIENQEKMLAEARERMEHERQVGDTIYAYANELQALVDRLLTEKRAGKDFETTISEILLEKNMKKGSSRFFEAFDSKNLTLKLNVDGLSFSLDLSRSLFDNATGYYERGKRARQKLEGATVALEESHRKLGEVESEISKIEASAQAEPAQALENIVKHKMKRKEWFEKFRWFTSSDGFLVVAGKDATSNEVLIKKHTEPHDIVFHADIVGAPFAVVKTQGKTPSEQCIHEAAEFAASYSRGWREGFTSIDVYWVKPQQLSKSGQSGESVGHGAFVIRGERNWQKGTPLKLAVGIITENGEPKFTGGPVNAVKTRTDIYIEISPGDFVGKSLLQHAAKALAQKMPKELQKKIANTSLENLREFIPYGKGRILEK